jgi:hypothetical protein
MKKRTYRNSSKPTKNRQYFNTTSVEIDLKRTNKTKKRSGERMSPIQTNIILLINILIMVILMTIIIRT